jgi:hypothetical protein
MCGFNRGIPLSASCFQFLETYPWNPEVLKRPDAEHLIMGLNSGAFSLETIVHQLSNPALQVLCYKMISHL